jgi:hypothetical protein
MNPLRVVKSALFSQEVAERVQSAFLHLGYVIHVEIRRDHHILAEETEKRYFVRFLLDVNKMPTAPGMAKTDVRLRRALHQWNEFLVAPLEGERFQVVHDWSFADDAGEQETEYVTSYSSCSCDDHQYRGLLCKHIWRVRLQFAPQVPVVSRDRELDFP